MSRVLPHSVEAERAILGAIMGSKAAKNEAFEHLRAEDFYLPAHRLIFDVMYELHIAGKPIDEVIVCGILDKSGQTKAAGGITYITDLRTIGLRAHMQSYIDTVRGHATKRALIRAAEQIIDNAYGQGEVADILEQAEKSIFEIGQRKTKGMVWAEECAAKAYMSLSAKAENGGGMAGLSTGIKHLDAVLGGLKPGQLIVIGARPSMGKTSLAMNLALNAAKNGGVTAVFSLEMTNEELYTRMLCSEAGVNTNAAMRGNTQNEEWAKLAKAMDLIGKTDMCSSDIQAIGLAEIRAKLTQVKAKKGRLDLVVVDYLQLMRHNVRKGATKAEEVGEITRMLKVMAMDLQVPIILASQLSRDNEKQGNRPPRLSDLRDSGSIEQDADVVLLIHREDTEDNGTAEIDVAKQRNGPKRVIKVSWRGEFCRFEDYY